MQLPRESCTSYSESFTWTNMYHMQHVQHMPLPPPNLSPSLPPALTALDSLVVRSTASPCSVPPEGETLVSTALVVPSSTLVLHRTLPSRGSCVHKRLSH